MKNISLMVAILCGLVFGGCDWLDGGETFTDWGNKFQKKVWYYKDWDTCVCYSMYGNPYSYSFSHTAVPCTEKARIGIHVFVIQCMAIRTVIPFLTRQFLARKKQWQRFLIGARASARKRANKLLGTWYPIVMSRDFKPRFFNKIGKGRL